MAHVVPNRRLDDSIAQHRLFRRWASLAERVSAKFACTAGMGLVAPRKKAEPAASRNSGDIEIESAAPSILRRFQGGVSCHLWGIVMERITEATLTSKTTMSVPNGLCHPSWRLRSHHHHNNFPAGDTFARITHQSKSFSPILLSMNKINAVRDFEPKNRGYKKTTPELQHGRGSRDQRTQGAVPVIVYWPMLP